MAPKDDDAAAGVRQRVQQAYKNTVDMGVEGLQQQTGGKKAGNIKSRAELLGYDKDEVAKSADLGLGCGNPISVAQLQPGEVHPIIFFNFRDHRICSVLCTRVYRS